MAIDISYKNNDEYKNIMTHLVRIVIPSQTRGLCSVSLSKAMMSNFQVALSANRVRIWGEIKKLELNFSS